MKKSFSSQRKEDSEIIEREPLTNIEENAIRYIACFVVRKIEKKYVRDKSPASQLRNLMTSVQKMLYFLLAEVLNKWLCVYVAETRSCSGEAYPPATVHSLLSGILRHMRSQNPMYPNFLDKSNPNFSAFTTTIDNFYKDLRSGGVGATSKHAEGISREEEELLWTSMVLNVTSTLGLLRAVFFSNGKGFCLRGGQEHRDLKLSQLERLSDPDRYVYHENSSKNKKGGLRELRLEHKSVSVIAVPDVGERCHVSLLDLYISKLPPEAVEQDLFYCRPLEQAPQDSTKPWYSAVPVGRNTLNKMVSSMCAEAGVKG